MAAINPILLTPREWQASAQIEASDLLGTQEGATKLVEAKRYGALADRIEQLEALCASAEQARAMAVHRMQESTAYCIELRSKLNKYEPQPPMQSISKDA